ncbi:hypothetical protein G9451_16295 [Enterobacter kobei]|uniref:hypothetical protein n=1 Tax=Enterobacter kobei TaxID=208224 RepID=UPI001882F09D|nr:hypothetical protein [Enterobacter kobei]MBE8917443.1 hypothetical protein [Enterobacter kobei]
MNKIAVVVSFTPFVIYFCYLTLIQHWVGGNFIMMGLLVSFMGTIFYALHIRALMKNMIVLNNRLLFITSLVLLISLALIAFKVGSDKESSLIAGTAVYTIIAFIFMFVSISASSRPYTVFDTDSKCAYTVINGVAYKMSDDVSKRYTGDLSIRAVDLSLGTIPIATSSFQTSVETGSGSLINPSSGLPMNDGVSGLDVGGSPWGNTNIDHGISVNPTSGIPMNGGGANIDVVGNSWGSSSSDYSGGHSSYDPNRGY